VRINLAATTGTRGAGEADGVVGAATADEGEEAADDAGEFFRLAVEFDGAEAISSAAAAFCCVILSISATAVLSWARPELCSAEAVATIGDEGVELADLALDGFETGLATSVLIVTPIGLLATESSILAAVSLAAAAERWARARTSSATTAKPMPASPARAASTAALRARMFV
jgi:hypothetical protein